MIQEVGFDELASVPDAVVVKEEPVLVSQATQGYDDYDSDDEYTFRM
jgi:hypothetical protein